MIPKHREAFLKAAKDNQCWIWLRAPNRLAERWIGKDGYIPKPTECKAKTADNPDHRFGGLVVNPYDEPEAFSDRARTDAEDKWREFTISEHFRPQLDVVEDGPDRGLVRKFGKFIYSDYDLMTILPATPDGLPTYTPSQIEVRSLDGNQRRWINNPIEEDFEKKVIREINEAIGIKMIQHGSEFMWDGVGTKAIESVLVFGPQGQLKDYTSVMGQAGYRCSK